MIVAAETLRGAWQLVSWSFVYEDGRPPEHPLGPDARGFIMYTDDGHVSALLMRGERPRAAPATEAERAQAYAESFGYSGRYVVRDGTVYHTIQVATNPALLGITSTRHISFDGTTLTLSGPDFTPGAARSQKIVWRRPPAAT